MSFVGDKFIKIRTDLNLTQKQFAEAIGMSQGRLSEIEKGKNSPSYDTLLLIKKKFNINMNYFFDNSISDDEYSISDIPNKDSAIGVLDSLEDIAKLLHTNIKEGKLSREDILRMLYELQYEKNDFDNDGSMYQELVNQYEFDLLQNYRQLSERDQGKVDGIIESMVPKTDKKQEKKKGSSISATTRDEVTAGFESGGRGIA
jgi:transcriptional regulator with XRE-family HTH domain